MEAPSFTPARRRHRVLCLGLLALTAACGKPPQGAGLFVRIERGSASSTCVKVSVTVAGTETVAGAKPFNEAGVVSLGILQQGAEPEVLVTAIGGKGTDCTPTVPGERASQTFRFPATGVTNEVLTLERGGGDGGFTNDGGVDVDGGLDGGTPDAGTLDGGTDAGRPDGGPGDAGIDAGPIDFDNDGSPFGTDCDDRDARRFPGNPEVCSGGIDEDCDNRVDCAQQPQCANATCGTGLSGAAQCQGTTCVELNCGNGLNDDLESGPDCMDTDCTNHACNGAGMCVGMTCVQPTETACADRQDNDGDRAIDCDDPDCNNQPCTDRLACTVGDRCVGNVCTPTGVPVCQNPPNLTCFMVNGQCTEPDAGCAYTPTIGAGCNDNTRCTTNDQCLGDGGCAGNAVLCEQNVNACLSAQGSCVEADGGCLFTPLTGTSCSDGNPCTLADTCNAGACISGQPATCVPGVCQYLGSQCLGDGGCDLRNHDAGVACASGTCDGLGNCERFPYQPSNFNQNDLPADAGPAFVVNCAATLAVTSSAVISSGCAISPPAYRLVPQTGAPSLVLFNATSMTITDAGSLTITGTQPVAFAVTGNIDIAGTLDVSAGTNSGPGADDAVACALSIGRDGGTNTADPRGGGSGGSFGSVGGTGGNPGSGPNAGASATTVSGNVNLVPLRGGCRGGNGGGLQGGGRGGRAGGAIQLSAAATLRIAGRVTSVGGGGQGGSGDLEVVDGPGGGAGGSGGAILLEGNLVHISGHVSANGGSGAEGEAGGGVGGNGVSGNPFSENPVNGGSGSSGSAGNGGQGAARNGGSTAATNGSGNGGGGGGGGGLGRIRVNSVLVCTGNALTMSPQASSTTTACQY